MFEAATAEPAKGWDTATLATRVGTAYRALVAAEAAQLELAAVWADLHAQPDPQQVATALPGREHPRPFGGESTPEVLEFAAAELGALQEMGAVSAGKLIADALDLRHRLPRLWQRLQAGQVRAYQARWVAQHTRHLSPAAAAYVDSRVAGHANALPWSRFQTLVEATIITADPDQAEARARMEAADRFVRATQSNEHGLKVLIAKANAGDVILFVAMADRIAQILQLHGDTDPADTRRAKAIGILANPAQALALLLDYTDRHEPPADLEEHQPVALTAVSDETPAASEARDDRRHVSEWDLHPRDNDAEDRPAQGPSSTDNLPALVRALPQDLLRRLRNVTLYVHLHRDTLLAGGGVARLEDAGPITLGQVRELLGSDCQITLQPVIDLADAPPVDGYEFPARLRTNLFLRNPADIFPFSTHTGRRKQIDHTIPYRPRDRGGPPGQTRIGNAGLTTTLSHRIKTHGRWQLQQPRPGAYLWRSPTGWIYLVDHTGTHNLGNDHLAESVWHAARKITTAAETPPPARQDDRGRARVVSIPRCDIHHPRVPVLVGHHGRAT
ncbi:hypothetical protein GCM10009841_00600 [Microlunatus panaciterrae]|uniref:DUF222 domain-containing protein n=1 Tax=Microlunatus panaciterrae TaxID=400768 RepID=A0ABS2RK07_9ACTN|nr:DUF222 domain-containing protein [Microlunatus panaciterrae]MBM7799344.1 hypothetical protein [Microlunatus panaciterrae]